MRLNGMRNVMSLKGHPEKEHSSDVVLECGHILSMPTEHAPNLNTLTSCGLCIDLLEERGMFRPIDAEESK